MLRSISIIHSKILTQYFTTAYEKPDKLLISCDWWEKILSKSNSFKIKRIQEMACFDEAWQDWLKTDNKFALGDRAMIEMDNGRYMNLISIIGTKS